MADNDGPTTPDDSDHSDDKLASAESDNGHECARGHAVSPGQVFCTECGAPLGATCPNGHPNPPGFAFCGDCGEPLASATEPSPQSVSPSGLPSGLRHGRRGVIAALVGAGVVLAIVAVFLTRGGYTGGDDQTQVETAQQFLQDRCDIPGDGTLTHLSTSAGDHGLTEISFTTSEDFVATVYVDGNDEFVDQVDCPGSTEDTLVVPPEWEGVGDPVEYLVASECGFGPETRFDLSLISISDAAPGEQPTWEIGLPDGTVGRLLPDGEVECPEPPPTTQDEPQQSTDSPSSDGVASCPDPLPDRLSPEQAAACTMDRWAGGNLDGASLFTTGPAVLDALREVPPPGQAEPLGCSNVDVPPPGNPNEQFGTPLNCVYQVSDGLTVNVYVDATPSAGGYVFAVALAGAD